jgi:hypothetical protein
MKYNKVIKDNILNNNTFHLNNYLHCFQLNNNQNLSNLQKEYVIFLKNI